MKKILIYLLVLLCIVFIIPSICTKKRQDILASNEQQKSNKIEEYLKYEYSKYSNIKIYHSKTAEIEELAIDEYLYGVVSAEMPASYNIEALKAQAIVARTYTLYQIINGNGKHGEADICDDSTCCQAWLSKDDRIAKWDVNIAEENWNKIVEAVNSTQGKLITYDGAPIDAFFHANSGGITETARNVWGGNDFPYLQSVETSGEDEYSGYNSEVEFSKEELVKKVKEKYSNFEIDFNAENCIRITEYTESGRVKTIKLGNIQIAGTEARAIFGLKSTNFISEINGEIIKFTVKGYGHGVGMSQNGAESMAQAR